MGKGQNGKSQTNQKNETKWLTILYSWDGKRSTFPDFRKAVTWYATDNKIQWILNTGRALFTTMQTLQAEAKKKKKAFKNYFSGHDDSIWTDALASRENRCVEAQLDVVKVDTLKAQFGSNFTEPAKCGFTDEDKHTNDETRTLQAQSLRVLWFTTPVID